MKKLLLASAVAALSVSAANAAPTIYGKAFLTGDYVNAEYDDTAVTNNDVDVNTVEINSHGSRLGFKGSEPMTASTDVIYQIELGLNIDDGESVKLRDTYLGTKNAQYGEFRVGKNTSVSDFINNVTVTNGYWNNLGANKLSEEKDVKALNMADSDRVDNSIVWMAPKYNGMPLELSLMYGADENAVEKNSDRNSGYGASLMFDQGTGLTAGLAYTKDLDAGTDNLIRGTVTYDMSKMMAAPVTLGVLYQKADYNTDNDETGLVVSAEMGLSNFARPASVYAQYNTTENLNGTDNNDSNQIVVGGKYMYKNNMIMHGYVGANSADIGNDDADVFGIGGGLEYKF